MIMEAEELGLEAQVIVKWVSISLLPLAVVVATCEEATEEA
jgi:hypothetical protein